MVMNWQQLAGNQLTSSGLLLMAVGAVLVYLKKVPEAMYGWVRRQVSMTVTVKDDDAAFTWVKEWFLQQEFTKRIRRVDMDSFVGNKGIGILPAPGTHWFWYKHWPYQATFNRSEDNKGWAMKRAESFVFWTLGRDRRRLEAFVQDVFSAHKQRMKGEPNLYLWQGNYFDRLRAYKQRSLQSVILPKGQIDSIIKDMEWFLSGEKWYAELGIPYHRGYLFYGIPGSGKSSLISGIADRFGMPIFLVSLDEMNDRTLHQAMSSVSQGSIVVLEDVDCMGNRKVLQPMQNQPPTTNGAQGEAEKDIFGVTMSGLLNVLDGFKAPHGVMFIMTTNHMEKLDAALLRPGRVDYRMQFGFAKIEQKTEMYLRFYPDKTEEDALQFILGQRTAKQQTMADFQASLMSRYQIGFRTTKEPWDVELPPNALKGIVGTAATAD